MGGVARKTRRLEGAGAGAPIQGAVEEKEQFQRQFEAWRMCATSWLLQLVSHRSCGRRDRGIACWQARQNADDDPAAASRVHFVLEPTARAADLFRGVLRRSDLIGIEEGGLGKGRDRSQGHFSQEGCSCSGERTA